MNQEEEDNIKINANYVPEKPEEITSKDKCFEKKECNTQHSLKYSIASSSKESPMKPTVEIDLKST